MSFHDDELQDLLTNSGVNFARTSASEVSWLFDTLQQNLLKLQDAGFRSHPVEITKGMGAESSASLVQFSLEGPIVYFGDMLTDYVYIFESVDSNLLEELRSIPEVAYFVPLFSSVLYRIDFYGRVEAIKVCDDLPTD